MIMLLYRPSPQVPKPAVHAAIKCYDASAYNIKMNSRQIQTATVDITWVFLASVFMAVNTILWTISYPEVRSLHSKEELDEHIDVALDIIVKCRERWPGTAVASRLYSQLAKACLKSYHASDGSHPPSSLSANSPDSVTDANSPPTSEHSSATTGSLVHSQKAYGAPPQFGYVFDQMPQPIPSFDYGSNLQPPQPSFRSNSIFMSPASQQSDRRFSYFPPEFTHPNTLPNAWDPTTAVSSQPPVTGPMNDQLIGDTSYFMLSTQYSFGPHMFAEQSYGTGNCRQGSLSQEQQLELMQNLETKGLTEIDNFMNISTQYDALNRF